MAKEIQMPSKYEVPDNWEWVELKSLVSILSGFPFKSSLFTDDDKNYPLIRIRDVVDGETNTYTTEECPNEYIVHSGDILIGMDGDFNIAKWRSRDAYLNQRVCKISSISKGLLNDYLYYFMPETLKKINDVTPSVTVKHLSIKTIEKISIPIPPLTEQQRIVDKIESLFSKLDEAKEKSQEVIDGFDSRRAAVLAEAFSGKLTEKWRGENAVKDSWEQRKFDEVAEIKSNLVDPAEYQEFPHIAPDNIEKRTGVLLEYHTIAEDGMTSGKHRFYPGQILYSKIRPYLSKVVIVDFDGLCSADMYPIEAKQNTRFLWYYMLSDEFLEAASSAGSRSVLPKINQKELSKIPVRITESEDEQNEVVRILDEIFAKENEARSLAEMVADKIEAVKKSILAKAFRGELGTNDSSDEPAEELLKKILTEVPVEEKKKSTTRKTKVKVVMNKDMLEAVREAGKITPERLKEETGLGIDEFYEELKRLIEFGQVSEKKEGGDVYLEVRDAN